MKYLQPIVLAMLAMPAFSGIYKWTDAQGRTHYSDAPPPAAKTTQLKLQSYSGPVEVSRATGADRGVTLYTTEWCGVCKRAKTYMKENNVPFSEWDVEKSDYGAAKFRQLGGKGVPLITIGPRVMKGFDASRFMELWKNAQSGQ
jgi:glutaredoxin